MSQQAAEFSALSSRRLTPTIPHESWRETLDYDFRVSLAEGEWLETKRSEVADRVMSVPQDARGFIQWFEDLKQTGPGQGDPLFDWLAEQASVEQVRWFLTQEVAGEAGFDDLVALTQLKFPTRPKLEMARNYWDEMGRGSEAKMHGPMLSRVAVELGITLEEVSGSSIPAALDLANLMAGLAYHRRYAYQSVGALGVIELTAPGRSTKVYQGLKRLGIVPAGTQYYLIHSTLDVKHSEEWNQEVIAPLVSVQPEVARYIAEGALMRLEAGAKCFQAYRNHFGL